MSYKKAVLLAAIGSTLLFVYPSLYFFVHFLVTTIHTAGGLQYVRTGVLWDAINMFRHFLWVLALTVFFVFLYMEASGLTSVGRRRKAAMASAVVMALAAVCVLGTYFGWVLHLGPWSHFTLSIPLLFMGVFVDPRGLLTCAAWVAFLIIFAKEEAPLLRRMTPKLAALLAAFLALRVVLGIYGFCTQLIWSLSSDRNWSEHFASRLWNVVLGPAITIVLWVPVLIFLVVVWRNRLSPAAEEKSPAAI
jgi:hypothetical protein